MKKTTIAQYLVIVLLSLAFTQGKAQNPSALYQNWKTAQDNLKDSDPNNDYTPTLPDFSFAGYQHGEVGLPSSFTQQVYDVTDAAYGAVANDGISDKEAIKLAIAAAEANPNGGIVFFPPGRFIVNDASVDDPAEVIRISKSNIVIKGSGSGSDGTELYQKDNTTHPNMATNDWVCPYLFLFWNGEDSVNNYITDVTGDAERETYSVEVADASGISVGQWVELYVKNTNTNFVDEELYPYTTADLYQPQNLKMVNDGVEVREIHKVAAINGNTIIFKDPIHRAINATYNWKINNFKALEEVGIQDLKYTGGFIWKHLHHQAPQELYPNESKSGPHAYLSSSGWSGIQFNHVVNGWITNVEFSDMSQVAQFKFSAYCSALDNRYVNNPGHNYISTNSATRCLVGRNIDATTGIWHGCGLNSVSIGNVLWRNESPQNGNSGMDSHASQPRVNLFDVCKGGFFLNMGGSTAALPNHLKYLVLWNFEGVSYKSTDVKSWRPNTETNYGKVITPIISGLKGFTMSSEVNQYQENESPGSHVDEESLYEAQLAYRLQGGLPDWVTGGANVPATGVSVSPTTASLVVGSTQDLTETVFPLHATNKTVSWSSSDISIATVDSNGVVTAIAVGTAVITVTTNDGNYTDVTNVTVTEAPSVTTYTETFENSPADDTWGPDSFVGDNNVTWTLSQGVKKTSASYFGTGKCLYMGGKSTNNGIGGEITSSVISGGVSEITIDCMKKWGSKNTRTMEIIVSDSNGTVLQSDSFDEKRSTKNGVKYTITYSLATPVTGDFILTFRNISPNTETNTITYDNINWTTYTGSGNQAKGSGSNTKTEAVAVNNQDNTILSKTVITPNPFSSQITVKLLQEFKEAVLFDVSGRIIFKKDINGKKEFALTPKSLNSKGIYFLKLIGNTTVETHKLVRE
ncbi:DUF4955 domain-containing protein [Aestuariivivens insulae]|uniref:DUF4955 domain-containing protein n=1 Tax=Aestuariivivens insulae TaxID=1621988 RepID=UPI001F58EF48|nr:DUF4955 domain-containing protein [Aestuariivivens insulae]